MILNKLAAKMTRHTYDTWLKPTKGCAIFSKVLHVQVPTDDFRDLGERFGDFLQEAMDSAAPGIHDLRFVTPAELAADLRKPA